MKVGLRRIDGLGRPRLLDLNIVSCSDVFNKRQGNSFSRSKMCWNYKRKKERIVSFNFSIPIITILNYLHTCFRDERRLEISSEINVADGLNNPWAFVVKKVTAIINIKDILFSIGDLFNDYLENFYVYFYIYNCITPSLEVVAYILTSHFLCSTFLYTAEIEERPRRSVVYY